MRVFIISDTHDNMLILPRFSELVSQERPDLLIHCGDYVSPFMIKGLLRIGVRIIGDWGNNDGDKPTILRLIDGRDFSILPGPREEKLYGHRWIIAHGWGRPEKTKRIAYALACSLRPKFMLYGHTHRWDIGVVEHNNIRSIKERTFRAPLESFDTLILNPGEASGWLYGEKTYIVVDIDDYVEVRVEQI